MIFIEYGLEIIDYQEEVNRMLFFLCGKEEDVFFSDQFFFSFDSQIFGFKKSFLKGKFLKFGFVILIVGFQVVEE